MENICGIRRKRIFALFLTSIRHAAAALLERTENAVNAEDLSSVPDLKEYRFRIQAKLFEYLFYAICEPIAGSGFPDETREHR